MKQNFTNKMIFCSLIFPILIFLIFGVGFVLFSIGAERTQRNIRKSHCKAIPNQSIIPTNL